MKKRIICCLLCALMLFNASCNIYEPTEGNENEQIFQEEQLTIYPIVYDYVLDEKVKADIEAYNEKTGSYFSSLETSCYYGEHEGKHVFFTSFTWFTGLGSVDLNGFGIVGVGVPVLWVWDGKQAILCSPSSNIFSFETSKKIAIIRGFPLFFCNFRQGFCD